jgi:hypothetical protein
VTEERNKNLRRPRSWRIWKLIRLFSPPNVLSIYNCSPSNTEHIWQASLQTLFIIASVLITWTIETIVTMDRFSSDPIIVLNFTLRQQDVLDSTSFQLGPDLNLASDVLYRQSTILVYQTTSNNIIVDLHLRT